MVQVEHKAKLWETPPTSTESRHKVYQMTGSGIRGLMWRWRRRDVLNVHNERTRAGVHYLDIVAGRLHEGIEASERSIS